MFSTLPRALEGSADERSYRLHVLPQAVVNPDFLEVAIAVPDGWRMEGEATFAGDLSSDLIMDVRVVQTPRAWLFDKLVLEPWRIARDLLGRIF
jgi:hypothetical protein